MAVLKKGDATKILDDESGLILLLLHEGWEMEGAEKKETPRRGRPPKQKDVEDGADQ